MATDEGGTKALPSSYQPPSVEPVNDGDFQSQRQRRSTFRGVRYEDYLAPIKDENLKAAFVESREAVVKSWLANELRNAKGLDLETYRERLSTSKQIAKIVAEIEKRQGLGKRPSSTGIKDYARMVLDFYIEYAFDEVIMAGEAAAREKRGEINRILTTIEDEGTYYDILGIPRNAERPNIIAANRRIAKLVHPDKNNDSDATKCMQAVAAAYETLYDPDKRKIYDTKIHSQKKQRAKNTFGEDFAPGAHGAESGDDEDLNDNGNPIQVPDVPNEVRKVHQKLRPYIETYFSNLEAIDEKVQKEINKKNKKIQMYNLAAERDPEWYQVQSGVLHPLREQQLRTKFDEINRNKAHDEEDAMSYIEESSDLSTDRSVYSNDSAEGMSLDISPRVEGHMSLARPLQPLKPGYTLLGDKILGYRVLSGRSKTTGDIIPRSFKFFIETPSSSLFKVVSGTEIGDLAAQEYHNLPEEEKNDVGQYLDETWKRNPRDFSAITRIGWVEPLHPPMDRYPETWVEVAAKGDAGYLILHRTALRKWLTQADKQIDSFCSENNIIPPWADTQYPDPRNIIRYMALEHPAPRRRMIENYQRRAAIGGSGGSSRLAMEDHRYRPRVTQNDGSIDQLTHTIEHLAKLMIEDRKDRQEDREILKRLLPSNMT
ncbi:hypothetical protein AK830_g5499 [Neonectria ditissima]|uniref:J domain-containing protein n=1 Tax=Neonectria ditissima TaxID=78410 RepID=A0A0N8H788_9HYPO|nr:hypothetical protein AK830_g5499 [Neonectria ditissima]